MKFHASMLLRDLSVAAFATGVALAFRLSLSALVGGGASILVFTLPVLAVAGRMGRVGGLAAVVFSTLCAAYFFDTPLYTFGVSGRHEQEDLLLFCVVGTLITFLADSSRQNWLRAQANCVLAEKAEQSLAVMYEKERKIADTLQDTLLLMPPENLFPGLQIKAFYQAVLEEARVGGDFSDALILPSGRVALVVGDVTGKGLAAACQVARIKMALCVYLYEQETVSETLMSLNRFLFEMSALEMSTSEKVTFPMVLPLTLAIFDPHSGQVEVGVAGCDSPQVWHADGTMSEVGTSGLMLATVCDTEYDSYCFTLNPDELMIFFTDGITEARQGREFFGVEGLVCAVQHAAERQVALPVIGHAILEEVSRFTGGQQSDDICLMLVRRTPMI